MASTKAGRLRIGSMWQAPRCRCPRVASPRCPLGAPARRGPRRGPAGRRRCRLPAPRHDGRAPLAPWQRGLNRERPECQRLDGPTNDLLGSPCASAGQDDAGLGQRAHQARLSVRARGAIAQASQSPALCHGGAPPATAPLEGRRGAASEGGCRLPEAVALGLVRHPQPLERPGLLLRRSERLWADHLGARAPVEETQQRPAAGKKAGREEQLHDVPGHEGLDAELVGRAPAEGLRGARGAPARQP